MPAARCRSADARHRDRPRRQRRHRQVPGPDGIAVVDPTKAYFNCWVTRRWPWSTSRRIRWPPPSSRAGAQGAFESCAARPPLYFPGRALSNAAATARRAGRAGLVRLVPPARASRQRTWGSLRGRADDSQDCTSRTSRTQPEAAHPQLDRYLRPVTTTSSSNPRRLGRLGAITTAAEVATATSSTRRSSGPGRQRALRSAVLGKRSMSWPMTRTGAACLHEDCDDIETFGADPPAQRRRTSRGREVTRDSSYSSRALRECHGGAGWTVSRPSSPRQLRPTRDLGATPFILPRFFAASPWSILSGPTRGADLAQPPIRWRRTRTAEPEALAIAEVAWCSARRHLGVPNDTAATISSSGVRSQGNLVPPRAAPLNCARAVGWAGARRS